ncbi:hypothetical protein JXA85_03920 [Candidatus Woesearchaeota archaeon]|nr:hypothetical protein [Candidatus Woesearchaeota archaeon]
MKHSEIIRIFSSEFKRELTINQVAKLIKKSYAFTNAAVHQLIGEGILKRRIIGSSILCSLDIANEKTIALLVYNSINRANDFLHSIGEEKRKLILDFVEKSEEICPSSIYLDSEITVVTDNKLHKLQLKGFRINTISRKEFESKARKINYRNMVVIKNHEEFWRMLARTVWFSE